MRCTSGKVQANVVPHPHRPLAFLIGDEAVIINTGGDHVHHHPDRGG